MATTTAITVTAVDNELYIIAIPTSGPSTGYASSELLHYVSGFNDTVSVTIVPQHVLPTGDYTLCFVGINWGGPSAFTISLTTAGTSGPVNLPPLTGVGVVSTAVNITV